MAVFRKVKKTDYTVIDNNIFKNQKLTLKAKGMICTMLSLPDDWNFSEDGLTSLSNDTKYSIRNTLKELMEYGYLTRTRTRDDKGVLRDYVYTIYEEPTCEIPTCEIPTCEIPTCEIPTCEIPTCEIPTLVNRSTYKILNNNKVLNNKKKKEIYKEKRFKKPTLEEVKEYCLERNNKVDAELFINYYESNGWKVGRNSMKDWKACVRTWERNKVNQHKESRYEREKRLLEEMLTDEES